MKQSETERQFTLEVKNKLNQFLERCVSDEEQAYLKSCSFNSYTNVFW